MKRFVFLIVGSLLSIAAHSTPNDDYRFSAYGYAGDQCDQYSVAYDGGALNAVSPYIAWVQGYETAFSQEEARHGRHRAPLDGLPLETIAATILRYCRLHPEKNFYQAVRATFGPK